MTKRKTVTPEHIATICDQMASGTSLRKAAKELGLNESAVRYHLTKSSEAFAHSARARELGCDALADECLEIADDPIIDPADKRIRIDTRIRLIGKWSQRYSDKLNITNKTEVIHKYDLDKLTDEQLDAVESILAHASTGEAGEGETLASSVH